MKKPFLLPLALAALLLSCQGKKIEANYEVIPLPQEITLLNGESFIINNNTQICYPENDALLQKNADFLAEYLCKNIGQVLNTAACNGEPHKNVIFLKIDDSIENEEGYELKITPETVTITGRTPAGVFYGMQTLRKSIPIVTENAQIALPQVHIKDSPRFGYRGMHLDVARHFFPADFVKKYIDILALHNINTFHWHLTDDQGWRIESKKFPKLTEIGSIRKETVIGLNSKEYDGEPYGGFYTQDEITEIIAYAQDRYITIIPEVDLPGHTLAVLAAYPEFGCTGGPYEVSPQWGIFEDVLCIGNEDAMVFLENILDEITDLFPSKYIHIGGDEAPRNRWKVCPKCQARIKAEGLKADKNHTSEDYLQTYCAQRMEKFLNNKGKQIIGWDEILEGNVAPNATIMSWRGMNGGIKAAQMGHDVIMAPTDYAYFDYYQSADIDNEPLSIGNLITIEKTYGMEPVPTVLSETEKKHIIGVQANLWTEYIATTKHVEYMVLPRMAALSEVQWTMPEQKDFNRFASRLPQLLDIYDKYDYNYATQIFDIQANFTPVPEKRAVEVVLSTIDDASIYYTLDGTPPSKASTAYIGPVLITQTALFRAVAIRKGKPGKIVSESINFNKATSKPITLKLQPSDKYKYAGGITLVDGLQGNSNYATGRWLGFIGGDMEAVIDLEQPTEISRVATEAIVSMSAWIMGSTGLEVYISDDNKEFRPVASKDYPIETDYSKHSIEMYEVSFDPTTTRYVKVIVKRSPTLPKGHMGEGTAPYMFLDELRVD